MKTLLNYFGLKPQPNRLLDLVVELVADVEAELPNIERLGDNKYKVGEAVIEISYFDADAFEEIRVALGYTVGKGMMIVLRNYIEHLVVINHEIFDKFHTVEIAVPTESFALESYRTRLDSFATGLVAAAGNVTKEPENV